MKFAVQLIIIGIVAFLLGHFVLCDYINPVVARVMRGLTEAAYYTMTHKLMIVVVWSLLIALSYLILYILRARNDPKEFHDYQVIGKDVDPGCVLVLEEARLGEKYIVINVDIDEYNAIRVGDIIQRRLTRDDEYPTKWRMFSEAGAKMSPERIIK